ncbi:MAG: LD-carboxypeptidase [Candidatus Sulfotelmatobacter sp.]
MSLPSTPRVKPPALKPGDTVGIVAPASNVKRADLEAGCEALRNVGYKPFYFDSVHDQDLYFAGSVERRTRELESMFAREDVRAIVCARGGYGSNYLLNALDLHKIKSHPKIFVGYSDLTTLLTYFSDTGLVTFHGPMVAKDWAHSGGVHLQSWQAALSGAAPWELASDALSGVSGLVDGTGDGVLYGGCLSILVASLGTPYEIKPAGTILFLEDLAAKPFQIDRMLMQLKLAGKFTDVRGIIFGEMRDCLQNPNQGYNLQDVILRIVGDLGIPVAYGLRSGHVTAGNITLPIGVHSELTVRNGQVTFKILEAAVTTMPASNSRQ